MTEPEKPNVSINTNAPNDIQKTTETSRMENDETITEAVITVIDENPEKKNELDDNKVVDGEKKNLEGKYDNFSKKLQIKGQDVLVIKNGKDVLSGDSVPNCCILGSPEHVRSIRF